MELSQLPRDVLVMLALEMDIEYVINLCQTSSVFNDKICRNYYFWLNKLEKDFGIKTIPEEAKREYLLIKEILKTEPDRLLISGMHTENLKMVKAAVEAGADPNRKIGFDYPIAKSMMFQTDEILNYLLDKTNIINDFTVSRNIFELSEMQGKKMKCRMAIRLYSIILPYIAEHGQEKYRNIWSVALIKLKQFYNEDKWCITDEFYNKWLPFYQMLAEKYP